MTQSLTLHVASFVPDDFSVEVATGCERINELFRFDIDVVTRLDEDGVRRLVDRRATLAFHRGQKRRAIHGLIASVEVIGSRQVNHERHLQLSIELVPHAWRLSLSHGSRVFEGATVPRVLSEVLAEHHVAAHFALGHSYPEREYITQYDETDYAFVSRIAAEAGIVSLFLHPLHEHLEAIPAEARRLIERVAAIGDVSLNSEVLMFIDDATMYPALDDGTEPRILQTLLRRTLSHGLDAAGNALGSAVGDLGVARDVVEGLVEDVVDRALTPSLSFQSDSGSLSSGEECVRELRFRHRLAVRRARYREYDPHRPLTMLEAEDAAHDEELVELAETAVGSALGRSAPEPPRLDDIADRGMDRMAARRQPGEHYEHHSRFNLPSWDFEREEPKRILRAARRERALGKGESDCPWLVAGHRFRLVDHPVDAMNASYVVVAIDHRWSARTMSSDEEQSYVNRFECVTADTLFVPTRPRRRVMQSCETATVVGEGRIHTNERGDIKVRFHWDRRGGQSGTCWLRAMQTWSGSGFGAQFIPRVGSEVVVGFEGGDPDRPIVLGGVYNAVCPPPFALPERKTVSGWHTRSVPDGGYNELCFDDDRGNEQIFMRAERDLRVEVKQNRLVTVDGEDRHNVHGERHLDVHGHQRVTSRQGQENSVGGDCITRVAGRRMVSCQSDTEETTAGNSRRSVGGTRSESVGGASHTQIEGDDVRRVAGSAMCIVGSTESSGTHATHVEGDVHTYASRTIQMVAEQELVLRCGRTTLRLGPDSAVLSSPEVTIQGQGANVRFGSGELRAASDNLMQVVSEKIAFQSSGAAIGLSNEAAIDGSRVLLNSPANAEDRVEAQPDEPTTIELTDRDGNPIPHQPFVITRRDGSTMSGALDADGKATVYLADDAEVAFIGARGLERC